MTIFSPFCNFGTFFSPKITKGTGCFLGVRITGPLQKQKMTTVEVVCKLKYKIFVSVPKYYIFLNVNREVVSYTSKFVL